MTDFCSITFEVTAPCLTTLELYDLSGKRILQVQELLTKGWHIYKLNGISSGFITLVLAQINFPIQQK